MQEVHPFRNWTLDEFVDSAMRSMKPTINLESAVSTEIFRSRPQPALARHIYVFPEIRFFYGIKYLIVHIYS